MPPGLIFLLICCVTVPSALLLAYLHARCLGWDPKENH